MAATTLSKSGFQPANYTRLALIAILSAALILGISAIPDLGIYAKVAFITFGLAIIGWTLTDINDTYIALVAAIVFSATGIDEPSEFFETLGDPLIWLMFASFIIAAAVRVSGLSERLAVFVTRYATTVRQLFILLTIVMIITAFLIPSTSGRAALMLPVFLALRTVMPNERIAKALSLLFPAVILLSAIASLIGAGAHLITADIIWRTGGEYLGFGRWMLMGLPFAIASSFTAMFVILFLFTTRQDRTEPVSVAGAITARKGWSQSEAIVAVVTGALVVLWATETVHGVNSTLIALIGCLLLTTPVLKVLPFKKALEEVDWGMLIFMAATLELGEALIESGGAQWLVDNIFSVFQTGLIESPLLAVALVAALGLLSHLVITSRSSRASVVIPLVIFMATALGFSPTTFAFMTAAATGFCLTLPVSAKPVAMFAKVNGPTYTPHDLLRLSGFLLPIHLVLLVAFAFLVWPALGLDIAQAQQESAPDAPGWISEVSSSNNPFPLAALINLGPDPYRDNKQVEPGARGGAGGESVSPADADALSEAYENEDLLNADSTDSEAGADGQAADPESGEGSAAAGGPAGEGMVIVLPTNVPAQPTAMPVAPAQPVQPVQPAPPAVAPPGEHEDPEAPEPPEAPEEPEEPDGGD